MRDPDVRRRRFLASLGTVCAATLAGCGDNGGADDTPTETPASTETPTPTTPNERAVAHYEAAIDTLVRNEATLDEWAATSFGPDETGTLRELGAVRDDLDAAEDAADGDLAARIEQARLVADVQELCLAYYGHVNVFYQQISEGRFHADHELHQRAAEAYAEARGALGDARTAVEDVGAALAEIDADALDEPALEYAGEPVDHLDLEDRRTIDGVERYAAGYENHHRSFVHLAVGRRHYDEGAVTDAREEWEAGRERARRSKSGFEAAGDGDYTPPDFREESRQLLGAAERLIEALDELVTGAREVEAGNAAEGDDRVAAGFRIADEL